MNLETIPTFGSSDLFHVVVESPRGSSLRLKYEPLAAGDGELPHQRQVDDPVARTVVGVALRVAIRAERRIAVRHLRKTSAQSRAGSRWLGVRRHDSLSRQGWVLRGSSRET
ncbi:MAG TPA: hypothetical protein VFS23_21445, partial [Vicinamibacterales bacterium]|nr:hypothetical protein [Vicinamibacterales bacterium]